MFVNRVNFVAAKHACTAAFASIPAANRVEFLALSPECFRLNQKLDFLGLGHSHSGAAVWRLFWKEREVWSREAAEVCPLTHLFLYLHLVP